MTMYPLRFDPIYKEKLWGGRRLADLPGRELPPGRIGESWDIASHQHGTSAVARGPLKGMRLDELYQRDPAALVGSRHAAEFDRFPLLVKLIDAGDDLSVQVHPDDCYAELHEAGDQGKSELWYVLAAEPGARIIYGLEPDTTKDSVRRALAEGRLEECLREVPVLPGEMYEVPAGLVHALGRGVLVAEIQQNSDTTYRLYDWGRLDAQGQSRELHITKALDVMAVQSPEVRLDAFFVVQERVGSVSLEIGLEDSFLIALTTEGSFSVSSNSVEERLHLGDSCLVPAACRRCHVAGEGRVLLVSLPGGTLPPQ